MTPHIRHAAAAAAAVRPACARDLFFVLCARPASVASTGPVHVALASLDDAISLASSTTVEMASID
jgi:hypothetical protein